MGIPLGRIHTAYLGEASSILGTVETFGRDLAIVGHFFKRHILWLASNPFDGRAFKKCPFKRVSGFPPEML